ncbi:MAG TPA: hypothetical protein VLQ20_07070 [Planococcus sp. (in: firmicutes)]|nr:hypothetical protein [Planococcus sp. (in: firmicutes)]
MDFREFMSKENYYISFKGFEEVEDIRVALRVILYGSTSETELLIATPGDLDILQIDFPSYAFYSVTFEDFTAINENERYEGNAFRIYEKSDLMDYLKKRTNLEDQKISRAKTYRHFSLACMEHQIDLVSSDEPLVKE